ncbi:Polyprenol reductase 2 [Vitis vinifera]|uniref:Polyprenol reductase 2 n=1 Tax=Vitis vinifera TaxID=29760 RepID=A0A438EVL7_VITVI|nr:Polyprenol reductase 2 [Vitis vinifera]
MTDPVINLFYIAAPLSLCTCCAVEVFNFTADQVAEINVEGRDLLSITGSDWWGYVKPITKLGWFEWIGAAIFIWGWVHQCRCHAILGSIRKERTGEYRIPHGDWFELVSSPHYLAEMVFLSLSPSFIVSPYKMFTLRLYMQAYWLQVGQLTSLFGYFLYLWWQIWALQLQKHKGGTSISLRTIHANAVLVFHISTSCVVILHRLQKTWMLQMLSHDHTM